MNSRLDEVYSVEKFRKSGEELIKLIAEHLENTYDNNVKVGC